MILLALLAGFAVGAVLATVGGGGGLLILPVFVYLLGEPVAAASTASLVVVAAAATVGALRTGREGAVCWRLALGFAPTVVLGTVLGALLGLRASGTLVIVAFVPLLLAGAWAVWSGCGRARGPAAAECPPAPAAGVAAVGLLVGATTGFFGVGGGFLFVPVLTLLVGLDIRRATATSLAVVAATALVGLCTHLLAGQSVDAGVTLALAFAACLGTLAGSAWGRRLPQLALSRGFAVFTTVVAVFLLLDALLAAGPR